MLGLRTSKLENWKDQIIESIESHGYDKSRQKFAPLAADGSPLPWYTYPAIEYLNSTNVNGLKIFEYGAGNSSLYFARRGAQVWSVEHNSEWFDKFIFSSSGLKRIMLRTTKESYINSIKEVDDKFDILIIDGNWRFDCLRAGISKLSMGGIVLLDNSDWYTDVVAELITLGYIHFSFSGFGPINEYCWTTSFFLKANCVLSGRVGAPTAIGGRAAYRTPYW
jgi:hypothetical protein